MIDISRFFRVVLENIFPILLIVCSAYLLWIVSRIKHPNEGKQSENSPHKRTLKGDIVGKSKFVLSQSLPEGATQEKDGVSDEKADIFASDSSSKTEKLIQDSELDGLFKDENGDESGELDMVVPLEYEEEVKEEYENLEIRGVPLAGGVSFEQMHQTMSSVVHRPEQEVEEQKETGRLLLKLEHTDMFEVVVSGTPEREQYVGGLIDLYMSDYAKTVDSQEQVYAQPVPKDVDLTEYL